MRVNVKTSWLALIGVAVMGCARPMAEFSYSENQRIAPVEVAFSNESDNAETYEWDFGDGTISMEETPTHTYETSGNYLVSLKAIKGKKENITQKRVLVNAPERCLVRIETEFGDMVVWLYDATPKHRDNFLKLAEQGFYDSLLFHRVIEGFMIQGGDPNSKNATADQQLGSGGPGYTVEAEFVDSLIHVKGALSAARLGDQVNPQKASSGSQFYIVQGREVNDRDLDMVEARTGFKYAPEQRQRYLKEGGTPFLDRGYTVFGEVIEGLEVIDKIAAVQTAPGDRPLRDVSMKISVIK